MFKTLKCGLVAATLMISFGASAIAHEYKLGDLKIDHPHARATVEGAPVSGGYMMITNHGDNDARLIEARTTFAQKAELHEMAMDGDVMKMRELDGGLLIPAGETVLLKPGGMHIMFMGLKEQLLRKDKHDVTLVFEKAGTIDVRFLVEDTKTILAGAKFAAEQMKKMDHSSHKKMPEKSK